MSDRAPIDVTRLIDAGRFIGLPLAITAVAFGVMSVDGFDIQAMAFAAPALASQWGIKRELLGPVLAASIAGMGIGSVLLGWLADRLGRKLAFCLCFATQALGSLLCIGAGSLSALFVFRFIVGLGLGGAAPLAAALVAEWTPQRVRAAAVAIAIVAVPLGGMLGASLAQALIPDHGWRAVFVAGALLSGVCLAVAAALLPESPKYLARRPQQHPRLARLLNRLIGEARFTAADRFVIDDDTRSRESELLQLLRSPYLGTTLLLWAAFSCNTLALYAFVNWLPTVLSSAGASLGAALNGSFAFNAGGIVGAVSSASVLARYGSRRVGVTVALLGAAAVLLIGVGLGQPARAGGTGAAVLALVIASGACLHGMQAFLYAVGAHSYPTPIRASGVGSASAVARVGGVLSSAVGSAFFALGLSVGQFFYILAGVIVLTAVSFACLRTHIPGRLSLPERSDAPRL